MLSASCRPLAGIVLFTLLSLSATCPPGSAVAWSGQQRSSSGPKYKQPSETAWPGVSQSYLYFAGGPFRSKLSPTAPLWHHTCTLPFFVGANSEALWQAFLSFLTGLGFQQRWTATMEESTNAQEVGRIHLHVFVEFKRPVDWTSLELVNTRLFREAAIAAPIIKARQIWHLICKTTRTALLAAKTGRPGAAPALAIHPHTSSF